MLTLSQATQDAILGAVTGAVDAGSGAGVIDVYTGAQPASPDDAAAETLLVSFTLNDPAFTAPATLVVSPAITGTAVASGVAGWARVSDSDGTAVFDGTIGEDFVVDDVNVTAAQVVTLSAGSLSMA